MDWTVLPVTPSCLWLLVLLVLLVRLRLRLRAEDLGAVLRIDGLLQETSPAWFQETGFTGQEL